MLFKCTVKNPEESLPSTYFSYLDLYDNAMYARPPLSYTTVQFFYGAGSKLAIRGATGDTGSVFRRVIRVEWGLKVKWLQIDSPWHTRVLMSLSYTLHAYLH